MSKPAEHAKDTVRLSRAPAAVVSSLEDKPYCYRYPHPAVTVDCVIFAFVHGLLKVILIERKHDPFQGRFALPGGFVEMNERAETAARRELKEETGVDQVFLEQFGVFDEPERDPRERIISIAYYALVRRKEHPLHAADDAADAKWFAVTHLPPLAFDHDKILGKALAVLRRRTIEEPIIFELLPERFTLPQLRRAYEAILGGQLNPQAFNQQLVSSGVLVPTKHNTPAEQGSLVETYRADRLGWKPKWQKEPFLHLPAEGIPAGEKAEPSGLNRPKGS